MNVISAIIIIVAVFFAGYAIGYGEGVNKDKK